MTAYWLLFGMLASLALVPSAAQSYNKAHSPKGLAWSLSFLVLLCVIGFREEVGGDWFNYYDHVLSMTGVPLRELYQISSEDPAYALLNWIGANFFGGIFFTNFVCSVIFSIGLFSFVRDMPRPWLALLVAVPYLIVVVAMGYSRQGVAIGLAMLAMASLKSGGILRFILWLSLAALFHKSAIVLMPMAMFVSRKHFWLKVIASTVMSVLLYFFLLERALDLLIVNYIDAAYDSKGALIRIVMNAIPAAVLLLFWKRFRLEGAEKPFWFFMALGALAFLPILYLSPSSTAVDRIALFWIPIQMLVFSRLPDAFGIHGRDNLGWVILVVAYSAIVFAVWLNYATHAEYWLPYKFAPIEWLAA
jgi:EpsG family